MGDLSLIHISFLHGTPVLTKAADRSVHRPRIHRTPAAAAGLRRLLAGDAVLFDLSLIHIYRLNAVLLSSSITKEQLTELLPPLLADIALQCRIFVPLSDGAFRIAPPLAANCRRIAKEYESGHPPLVSPTILCYYLKTIYPSSHTNWKNTDRPIIHYPCLLYTS